MPQAIINADNLGKCYQLQHRSERGVSRSLRESLMDSVQRFWGKLRYQQSSIARESFWALSNVGFSIQQGEVVGIIGRNGAGKSTLLKILSRITKPTTGRCTLRGRVGSLLEVGTGFHPELTGRENIFMNGTILGMSRREIRKNFDQIVEFAEIEQFLDTPVKRYSSGMYVRLAFAVAAHLEPEILIVDEVLSVGDANFQKKCLGKMEDVASHGRTVLFVSHSMPMIQRLCSRAIVLDQGQVKIDGDVNEAVHAYLSTGSISPCQRSWVAPEKAPGNDIARLKSVRILNSVGHLADTVEIDQPYQIEIEYWKLGDAMPVNGAFNIFNEEGVLLFGSADFLDGNWKSKSSLPGVVKSRCVIPANLMAEGTFSVLAAVVSYNPDQVHAVERDAVQFQVIDKTQGTGVRGEYAGGRWPGVMRPMLDWQVTRHEQPQSPAA